MEQLQEKIAQLNEIYLPLEMKAYQMAQGLYHRIFSPQMIYYNGHRITDKTGERVSCYFPLPVVNVPRYCEVVIHLDHVEVQSKLSRTKLLENSFEKLADYRFEVYGDEDHYRQFYGADMTIMQMKETVRQSDESQLCFFFSLDFDIDGDYIYEFVKLLRRQGFHD